MIYGDNPQKINEREDKLGLKSHSYAPQILFIMQAGNLYVYCGNNPILYRDGNGESLILSLFIGAAVGAVISGGFKVYDNVKQGTAWNDGLEIAMLAGGVGGAISCITIPGVGNYVCAAIFGAAGNLPTQVILGKINNIHDVVEALNEGAAAGLLGCAAAELLSKLVTIHFSSLTKSEQKYFLRNIGKISNRQLIEIRQAIKQGVTPAILEELIQKYGYNVLVSAIVSTTATSIEGGISNNEAQSIFFIYR